MTTLETMLISLALYYGSLHEWRHAKAAGEKWYARVQLALTVGWAALALLALPTALIERFAQ